MEDPKLVGINYLAEEQQLSSLPSEVIICGITASAAIALVPAFPWCTYIVAGV